MNALLLLLVACHPEPDAGGGAGRDGDGDGDGDDTGWPVICNDAAAWDGATAFEERTAEWGLDGVTATRYAAADLDGDGWTDLVAVEGAPHVRDDFEGGVRYHWVLMNRASASGREFVDETEASGLFATRDGGDGRAGQIHVFADVDDDGDTDAFSGSFFDANNEATDPGDRSEVLLNDGTGHFALAAQSDVTIDDGYATGGASFADVDADGLIDLWVVGWYEQYGYLYGEQDHLYRGAGDGAFADITEESGLEMIRGRTLDHWIDGEARRPAYGATSCDLDGDALPDLLASNYGRSWNQQWMNRGGTFEDLAMESGFAADENLDYSDNQYYRCWCEVNGCDPDPGRASLAPCETYADYWYVGFDDQPARLAGNSFTTACGDLDGDADMDLVTAEIVHWHIGQSADPTEILLNDGSGSFSRPGNEATGLVRDHSGADWNDGDLNVAIADLDGDALPDILLVSSDYPDTRMHLWRQSADGTFEEVAEAMGIAQEWPAGLAVADFDRDGDLDVVTGSSTARSGTPWTEHSAHFHENVLDRGNRVRVRLVGTDANRSGIGARVAIESAGRISVQEVSGGYGHMGMHHDLALTFGLGESCAIDSVTVTWPGGATDSFADVPANYEVTLTQGGTVEAEPFAGIAVE